LHNSRTPAIHWPSVRRRSVTGFAAAVALATLALAGLASACADSLASLGPTPALASSNADQLFEAFRARFNQPQFSPSYETARKKLAKSALVPSGVFDDNDTWSAKPSATVRMLFAAGNTVDGHYLIDTRPSLNPPARPGDARHFVALERLAPSIYRWDTRVDLAVGDVSAADVSALISALLAAPEGHTDRELRDDYRSAFPRASAAFGRGLAIDSLHVAPAAGGLTSVTMTLGFHPDVMRTSYPALTAYIDKYLGPAKYHFAVTDRAGSQLFDVVGHDRQATLRYRLQFGRLTSLSGPPHAWPDTVQLTSDLSLKVKVFTVGFHSLLTDFIITNSGHDRGWAVVAQHEPKWDLPFVAERLIRSPLRRPFEDGGALFRVSVHDSAGQQTVFERHAHLDVQESTIMRFLGGLSSHALGDIDASVVADEGRYLREGFTALEADMHAAPARRPNR
jgi:hypothetical protein